MTSSKYPSIGPRDFSPRFALAAAALSAALLSSACVPLIVGGAVVGGGLVATDRRTSGTQLEDEGIELRAASRMRENLSERAHVNITSFNRQVLLTGEVATPQEKLMAEQLVVKVDNVRTVVNELGVMPASPLTQRSSDAFITGKVKASMLDAKDIFANSFKVFTERNVVYIMGRVTARESKRAAEIARGISGVEKVVRVVELITEEELQSGAPPPKTAPAAVRQPSLDAAPAATPRDSDMPSGAVVTPIPSRSN